MMLMRFLGRTVLVGALIAMLLPMGASAELDSVDSKKVEQGKVGAGVRKLPVSVYLLTFSDQAQLSAQYSAQDVAKLFDEVNAIWSKSGITWSVDSVTTVPVAGNDFKIPTAGFANPRAFRDAVAGLIPDATSTGRWRVYLVRQFPINGSAVYIIEKGAVLYGELNKFGARQPVILAHELGHSLGLQHVSMSDNLMYAGPEKSPELTLMLDPQQIKRATEQASVGPLLRTSGVPSDQEGRRRGGRGRRPASN